MSDRHLSHRSPLVPALILATTLTACSADPSAEPGVIAPDEANACGAGAYQDLVGASLAAIRLPDLPNARYIAPDTAVTMDYDPTRINVYLSDDRVITRIACG